MPGKLNDERVLLQCFETEAQRNVTNRPEIFLEPRIASWIPLFRKHYSRKRVGKSFVTS